MSDWQASDTAPDGRTVMTKIDDAEGCRNEQALRRSGRLWFVPDGSMYVYYRPTHWREMTDDERAKETAAIVRKAEGAVTATQHALASMAPPER